MALAATRGEQTLVGLSQQSDVHANEIKQWKEQFLEGRRAFFDSKTKAEPADPAVDVQTSLHASISELTLENDASYRAYAAPLGPRVPAPISSALGKGECWAERNDRLNKDVLASGGRIHRQGNVALSSCFPELLITFSL